MVFLPEFCTSHVYCQGLLKEEGTLHKMRAAKSSPLFSEAVASSGLENISEMGEFKKNSSKSNRRPFLQQNNH